MRGVYTMTDLKKLLKKAPRLKRHVLPNANCISCIWWEVKRDVC